VLEAEQVGAHLVMRVEYPNCSKCSYEGIKVLVFEDVGPLQALKWSSIDPHFSDRKGKSPTPERPPPLLPDSLRAR